MKIRSAPMSILGVLVRLSEERCFRGSFCVPGSRVARPPTGGSQMNAAPKVPCPRPEVLGGPVPYLMVEGALRASELYQRAFGAHEVGHIPPDDRGRTMHAHLYVNGGSLMLTDPYPEHGCPFKPHQGYSLHLQVDDVEA